MEAFLNQVPLLLLISTRLIGMMISSPVFSNRFVPPQLRFALSFLLAFAILPGVAAPAPLPDGAGLLIAVLMEMLTGLVIGFITALVLAVMQIAGALIDLDMGFTLVNVLDPMTGHNDSILGSLFQSLVLVFYLGLNAHHWLIRALVQSYELVPAGGRIQGVGGALYVVYLFGDLLALAVQIVLPFTAVMLLTMLAFSGVNRAVAQMNIFALGLGTKSLVGLLILVLLLPYYAQPMTRIIEASYRELLHVLDLMRPS
ncbi:MAG: flagellar biosynthetic protein FliR [Bacillota bacterium]